MFGQVASAQQQAGSIRGVVYDRDFDAPLALPQVQIVETGAKVTGTDQGNYVFVSVPPGRYTLVFSKPGYARQIRTNVVVSARALTEVDAYLSGEFTEMDEFVVEDLAIGGGTEAGLLRLRLESPALIDSISSEMMSQAGASDAATALNLIAGATVENGKYAVIRGLPDRFVSAQLDGFRLPTADEEKRAVQLDQFPAAIIQSVQVTKTFTPNQQGDASGGAVNVVLKGIPNETTIQFSGEYSWNSQVSGRHDFLTYDGGGVNFWGKDSGGRSIDSSFDGVVGTTTTDAPVDYKWSVSGGSRHTFDTGLTIGGFAGFFYERDSSFYDNGVDDQWWIEGGVMVPQKTQVMGFDSYLTHLLDVTQGSQLVQWGALGTFGLEDENNRVDLTYLYTRVAEDTATLAEDTRGKAYFFPGYDPNDPNSNGYDQQDAAPYTRTETLDYTERMTSSLLLTGKHTLPSFDDEQGDGFRFLPSELSWGAGYNTADLNEPDKRQFGEKWYPPRVIIPGVLVLPAVHLPLRPDANFLFGNFQQIWKDISEHDYQGFLNWELPFEQWSGDEGYFKVGAFYDNLHRDFQQQTYSNFNDPNGGGYNAPWEDHWSAVWGSEGHPVTASLYDVDYTGDQQIVAGYGMAALPINSWFQIAGGVRYETTDLSIVNDPEILAQWIPPGAPGPVHLGPGDADVDFHQADVLPQAGFDLDFTPEITLRGSYAKTVARQTFKELTPIIQQEYLGGPVFIGNPNLQMASLQNFDLRLDWTPYDGGLVSGSAFYKDVTNTIEYVQAYASFTYTTPTNFPKGRLWGFEVEVRQDLGHLWDGAAGLAIGANGTYINSQVTLSEDYATLLDLPPTRDMTGAPDFLVNLYATYDLDATGTQFGVFYTIRGDTLVAGATRGTSSQFVPDVYEPQYDNLNVGITQKLGKYFKLRFQAKNLTNSPTQTVYRSPDLGDTLKTSYTSGIELSISLSANFEF